MDFQNKKCSLEDHQNIDAIKYCQECNVYLCNKCEQFHGKLCKNHHTYPLDKNLKEIFTGFCKEENHNKELNYFCKNHNVLCCTSCISKIETRGNGKHSKCDVCDISEICDEKKKTLGNNIKKLDDLSKLFDTLVNDLKKIFEEIEKNKDSVKLEIQNMFTKIRTELNKREDQLMLEVDEIFDKKFNNKNVNNVLKETKFPEKIKTFLEKGKIAEKDWDKTQNKNVLINDCVNIENTIAKIDEMNKSLEKSQKQDKKLYFYSQSNEMMSFINNYGTLNNLQRINQQEVNINIDDFNPGNLTCVKQIASNFGNCTNYCVDCVCFFISKNKEHVLGYIDNSYKTIIFWDINDNKELKKFNNAHSNSICTIKYYPYNNYDMILSCSYNYDIKIWNYNEQSNILTISNIRDYNNSNGYQVYTSCIILEPNDFKIFCVGRYSSSGDYIKMYNSNGSFNKNIGNYDAYRHYIDSSEVNGKKYLIAGGNKGVQVFNYPELTEYNNFNENNDTNYHNYAKIVKINNNYNLIDVGSFNHIKIWDFINKNLICKINSDTTNQLEGFVVINDSYLIIGSCDKNIKIFDIQNKYFIKNITKHTSDVIGIKSVKDKNGNDFIVSYSQDKNIYLWRFK